MRTNRRSMCGCLLAAVVGLGGGALPRAEAQPVALDVSGMWATSFSGISQPLRLTQAGVNVAGVYGGGPVLPGAMAGRLTGNVMVGRWTDAASSGGFRLVFGADGRTFQGTWGRTLDSQTSGGAWQGTR